MPGVARVSSGFKCERDLDVMVDAAERAMREAGEFASFKVAARRNHTDFAVGSMDMNRIIGAKLCAAFPEAEVRMKGPDLMVGVEVVQNASYVYARSRPGIGGLPVGSSGTVMCLLSSGIDSPVALWRLARRGAVCVGVHFSGRPQTSDESEYLVDDIAHVLERTGCVARVYVVPFGDVQREISLLAPPSLRVILYRRLMFKVTERLAAYEHAGALVTGESLGQVASQTLENIRATDAAVGLPVFRPLIGTDKLEIIAQAEEAGDIRHLFAGRARLLHAVHAPQAGDACEAGRRAEGGRGAPDRPMGRRARRRRRAARLRLSRLSRSQASPIGSSCRGAGGKTFRAGSHRPGRVPRGGVGERAFLGGFLRVRDASAADVRRLSADPRLLPACFRSAF